MSEYIDLSNTTIDDDNDAMMIHVNGNIVTLYEEGSTIDTEDVITGDPVTSLTINETEFSSTDGIDFTFVE